MIPRLVATGLLIGSLVAPSPTRGETLRIATYNVELTRDGPGLALRDIQTGSDPQIRAISEVIDLTNPDVLALQGIDYDYGLEALTALNDQLSMPYAHVFALPTNRGLRTGIDADGNGRTGDASDAHGFGRFYGQGAMAILSRHPIDTNRVQDFTTLLWIDFPDVEVPRHTDGTLFPSEAAMHVQRLSSSGHWIVPIRLSDDVVMSVMTFHASPPVFDGAEDRNGLRNAAEISLWSKVLDGSLGTPPARPFVIAGSATLDPYDSAGRNHVIQKLLADPRIKDPAPASPGAAAAADQGHIGQNALDTVDWPGVGRLRVDYVLPSADVTVVTAGTFWPADGQDGHSAALRASRHRLVWVDILLGD